MGTASNTNSIDEDKKCELSIRVVAMLMAMIGGKAQGITEAREGTVFAAITHKSHLETITEAMAMGDDLNNEFKRVCEEEW